MKTKTLNSKPSPRSDTPKIEWESFSPEYENPGVFPFTEANRILEEKISGIWFLNPIAWVRSSEDSEEFFKVVNKRQAEWYRYLSRLLKNRWRRERNQMKDRMQRAFEYDGVIVFDGMILTVDDWKRVRTLRNYPAPTNEISEITQTP